MSKKENTFIVQIAFDDHDSYYEVPESICREILAHGCPKDPHDEITEKILQLDKSGVALCKPASISSSFDVDFCYCDTEDFDWEELKEQLEEMLE